MGDATLTDVSSDGDIGPESVVGVMWLTPEERFDALQPRMIIGRSEECALRLEDSQVSRQHASLERDGPLWLLRDSGSKNGTRVNGQRHDVVAVKLQDVVRIGAWVGVICSFPRASVERGEPLTSLVNGVLLSAPTRAALGCLEDFARRDISIAIYGETGTGKEGIAQTIHQLSARPGRLVALNCAAVPEAMAEAMLFGHCRGAFTGAQHVGEGHVRAARGGTLFLDEIGDLPLAVQGKLLRVFEERRVTPLGSTEPIPVDFRLVAACQEPLSKLVGEGTFRADLYARLCGVEVTLPPLRERRQEVLGLFSSFLAREATSHPELDGRLIEALCVYDWPGNVRELKQLATLLGASRKRRLTVSDLPQRFRGEVEATGGPRREQNPRGSEGSARRLAWLSRHARELDLLRRSLDKHDGNVSNAALEAGIPRHRARRLLAAAAERVGAARK